MIIMEHNISKCVRYKAVLRGKCIGINAYIRRYIFKKLIRDI